MKQCRTESSETDLIATAKVNLAGAVYWRTPWPGEKWEVE